MIKERIDKILKELRLIRKEHMYFISVRKEESIYDFYLEKCIVIIKKTIEELEKYNKESESYQLDGLNELKIKMKEEIEKGRELGLLEDSPWDPR